MAKQVNYGKEEQRVNNSGVSAAIDGTCLPKGGACSYRGEGKP